MNLVTYTRRPIDQMTCMPVVILQRFATAFSTVLALPEYSVLRETGNSKRSVRTIAKALDGSEPLPMLP